MVWLSAAGAVTLGILAFAVIATGYVIYDDYQGSVQTKAKSLGLPNRYVMRAERRAEIEGRA